VELRADSRFEDSSAGRNTCTLAEEGDARGGETGGAGEGTSEVVAGPVDGGERGGAGDSSGCGGGDGALISTVDVLAFRWNKRKSEEGRRGSDRGLGG
jgi:hypothetical protein